MEPPAIPGRFTLDLKAALEEVADLEFEDTTTRYWTQLNGDALAIWADAATGWDRFTHATVRRSALPRSEHKGKLSSMTPPTGGGLHEPIHIVAFPDNIFGVEFNFYGPPSHPTPSLSGLRHRQRRPAVHPRTTPTQELGCAAQEAEELRLVDLQVRSSYAQTLATSTSRLGRALRAAAGASKAEVVGLTLRPEPHGTKPLSPEVTEFVNDVATRHDLPENATTSTVKGLNSQTGRVDTVDLLEDKLVCKTSMLSVGGNSRAIKPESAYEAIEAAYNELHDELASPRVHHRTNQWQRLDTRRRWRLDGVLPDAAVALFALIVAHRFGDRRCETVDGRRDGVYAGLVGLHSGLLGFVLAALTIVLGYAQLPRFEPVRAGGHFRTLFDIYIAAVKTHTLTVAVSLTALFLDTDTHPHNWLIGLTIALTALAMLRLARVLWVTTLIVGVVIEPTDRAPGEQ